MATDRRTTLTRAGVRVLTGAAGLAASAVVAVAVFTLPLPSAQAQPQPRTVTPVPAAASAVCPGSLLSLGADGSTSSLTALGTPAVIAGGDSASPASVPVAARDLPAGAPSPAAFQEPAQGGREPLLAAAQSLAASSAELSGFAAANCARPDFEQWLVGGATSLGTTTLVVLGNPGDVAATVSIEAYSEQGLADAAGGKGIVVQPHSQHIVPLAGLVPNASATVVHVTSTGGTVSAQLQESEISGVTPQGAEWVGPGAAPAKKVVIPGAVFDGSGLSAATATDSGDGGVPVLRVLPVGGKDAKLTIGVRPDSGKGGGVALTATASHGVVSEIPLDKVGKGTFTISVQSTQPVAAAVRTSTVSPKGGADFGWYSSSSALTGPVVIPVAAASGVLHLANTSSSSVKLTLTGKGGGTVTVPAGASISRQVHAAGVLTTTDAKGVHASVSFAGAGWVAAYAVYPTSTSASALTVYQR